MTGGFVYCTDDDRYILTLEGCPLWETTHNDPISGQAMHKMVFDSISRLLLFLTKDDRHTSVQLLLAEGGLMPWSIQWRTLCLSPENYYLLWMLDFLSSFGLSRCKKCNNLFQPAGIRPGGQRYCPACKKTNCTQRMYHKKQNAALKAIKNDGLSIEESAKLHNVTIERLSKILSGESKV